MGEYPVLRILEALPSGVYRGPDLDRALAFVRRPAWFEPLSGHGAAGPSQLRFRVAFHYRNASRYLDRRYPPEPDSERWIRLQRRARRRQRLLQGVYESSEVAVCPTEPGRITRLAVPVPQVMPAGAYLEFGVGVLPRRESGFRLTMRARVIPEGRAPHVLWERSLGPEDAFVWDRDVVDLGPWVGQRVRLEFECRGNGGIGLWENPVVWASGPRPAYDLVLVLVDDLRTDALSSLGGSSVRTPNMDRFREQGTLFSTFVANGTWARPATLALLTGCLPPKAKGQGPEGEGVAEGTETRSLAWHLGRLGYVTRAISGNQLEHPFGPVGRALGFSSVVVVRAGASGLDAMQRAAVAFLRANARRPFFLLVHYHTLESFLRPGIRARHPCGFVDRARCRYLRLVERLDEAFGGILAALERFGLARHTVVALVGTSGVVFDPRHDRTLPLLGLRTLHRSALSVWDEVVEVPLILRLPGKVPAGGLVPAQVRSVDLLPTLLELMDLPAMAGICGDSAVRALGGGSLLPRPAVILGLHVTGLRARGFKYVRRDRVSQVLVIRGHRLRRPEELYDLESDPEETRDLSDLRPRILERMRSLLARLLSDVRGLPARPRRRGSGRGLEH